MQDAIERARQMTGKMLGKQLYVIHTTPVAPREQIVPRLPEHLEHQVRLEKSGVMFAAGPMTNEDGSADGGLIVIRAESFDSARRIADSDPLHKAGLRTYTIRRWAVVLLVVSQAALFPSRVPVLAITIGAPPTGEMPDKAQWAGLALVTAGLLVASHALRRR
jgi:uncharacterized protein YciI